MDAEAARLALRSLPGAAFGDEAPGEIVPIEGGWSFWTFGVGPDWIFRFPRSDAVAAGLEREIRLLPALRERVSFAVPDFEHVGRRSGRVFVGYRRIAGRALAAADVLTPPPTHRAGAREMQAAAVRERVARMLAELHGFPLRDAAALLRVAPDESAWRERYRGLESEMERRVLPLLEPALRAAVERSLALFRGRGLPHFAHPVLVHCDLGPEHILVEPGTGRPAGMIDFEDASLGDPVIDFVGLRVAFGAEVTRDVLARYGGPPDPGFVERLHFYRWMASVHAVLYGLDEGDPQIVADGLAGLEARIARDSI